MRSDDEAEGIGNGGGTMMMTPNKKAKLPTANNGAAKVPPTQAAPSPVISRPIAMRQALENPATKWKGVPDLYRADKEFVAEFIRKAHALPTKAGFERLMAQDLRLCKEVTLAFLSRADFCELYADRQLYCPHHLCNDKDVMLQYVQKIPRALQMAECDICDDKDVVMAAVRRDGFEIQYASCRLQADEEVIRAACAKSGRAIEVCTDSDTLQMLLHDRDFLLTTFRAGGGAGMRSVVDPVLMLDEELWLEAIINGLAIRHLPKAISYAGFWVRVMSFKSSLFYDIQLEFQNNPNIARAAILAPDISSPLLDHLYYKMPEIFDGSHEIALAVVKKARFAKAYLQRFPALFRDPEIMRHAVVNTPALYFDIAEPLSKQIPIVTAALAPEQTHRVLTSLGNDWLMRHQDICCEAIRVAGRLMETANAIPDEVWQNSRPLVMQWLKRGCRVLSIFEARLQDDRELALTVAEHVYRDYMKIGESFREDPNFVKEAVALNGRNLKHVQNPSMELVVLATATYPPAATNHPQLSEHLVEKLALHDVFRGEFLRGISLPTSKLYQLNVDAETSSALKQTVAQFLDVPTGKRLALYHRCQLSLQNSTNNSAPAAPRAANPFALAVAANANPPEPLDLPLNYFGLRASLRGTTVADNAQADLPRAANMRFDDGLPFLMLRVEQQRVAQDQNRLAQVMRMELDMLDVDAEPVMRHVMRRNMALLDRLAMPAPRDGEAAPFGAFRGADRLRQRGILRDALRGDIVQPMRLELALDAEAAPHPPAVPPAVAAAEPAPPHLLEVAPLVRALAAPARHIARRRMLPDVGAERDIADFVLAMDDFLDDEDDF